MMEKIINVPCVSLLVPTSFCDLDLKLHFVWILVLQLTYVAHVVWKFRKNNPPMGPRSHFFMVLMLLMQPGPFVSIGWLENKATLALLLKDL